MLTSGSARGGSVGSAALALIGVVLAVALVAVGAGRQAPRSGRAPRRCRRGSPTRTFWRLSTELSEPNGSFRSENLVSNEHTYQYVIPSLLKAVAARRRLPRRRARSELHLHHRDRSRASRSSSTSGAATCCST